MLDQFTNEKGFEWLQQEVGFLVEAEYGSGADRDTALIPEVVADAVIRDELLLRRIDRLHLNAISILHGSGHTSGKHLRRLGLKNAGRQKVVGMDEVKRYIEEGWEYLSTLPSGEAVIRLPSTS